MLFRMQAREGVFGRVVVGRHEGVSRVLDGKGSTSCGRILCGGEDGWRIFWMGGPTMGENE